MKTILFLMLFAQPRDTVIHFYERTFFPELKTDTEIVKETNPYFHKGDTIFTHHWLSSYGLDTNRVKRRIQQIDSIQKAEKFHNDEVVSIYSHKPYNTMENNDNKVAAGNMPIQSSPYPRQYKTEGERRVRNTFNPSAQDFISQLKSEGADFLNTIDQMGELSHWTEKEITEFRRCKATAMTQVELGAMMAVKAATVGL